jgi:hypothetical protein
MSVAACVAILGFLVGYGYYWDGFRHMGRRVLPAALSQIPHFATK